ncbi:hypothetical protein [Novosphingobium sp. KN65.2]|uniref:hypothetical protein n=1 Tax=Novosphingobium sp. KN65.2 TaxID=1478134 RepID=UPI0005DC4BC6|nr:hypothetical protein [Novosphingobium sp. KN65.2]CDO36729.1 hypothetical protein SPHV1_2410002 [Novosphingobium sp. KN65.2]
MNIAMGMDFAKSHLGTSDTRVLALALATGMAGFTVTYPAVTVSNGTVGDWMGKLEVKPLRLTSPTFGQAPTITTTFQDSAEALTQAAKAGAIGLTSVLAPTSASYAATGARSQQSEALSPAVVSPNPASRQLSPTRQAPQVLAATGTSIQARLPEPGYAKPQAENVERHGPLDAVRIAMPPSAAHLVATAPLHPDATLKVVAPPIPQTAVPVPTPTEQSLASGAKPDIGPAPSTGPLSGTDGLGLFSQSEEVRDFDLAKLTPARRPIRKSGMATIQAQSTGSAELARSRPEYATKVAKVPDRIVGDHILHVAGLSLEGMPAGSLTVRIGMTGDLSVKLADLLAPVKDQMAPETFDRLASSAAAADYVSFADLRAAGFDIHYDAGGDRLMVSAQF